MTAAAANAVWIDDDWRMPPAPFDAIVERLLDFLERTDHGHRARRSNGFVTLPPRFFDGAEPWVGGWMHQTHQGGAGEGLPWNEPCIFIDVRPEDLIVPLDIRTIALDPDDGGLQLERIRRVLPRDVRGRAQRLTPYMAELTVAKEQGVAGSLLYGYVGEGRWVSCDTAWMRADLGNRESEAEIAEERRPLQAALGLAFLRPFQWRVRLRLDRGAALEMPTDPAGAAALFRLRDIPPGRSRRAALRHWVRQHWRMTGRDAGPDLLEELFVRRHLRGATEFSWNGLSGRITPSWYALRDAAAAVDDRAARRRAGTDRRVRPREDAE